MTPQNQTTVDETYEDISADDILNMNQKKLDRIFRKHIAEMTVSELVQLHRIAGGLYIYDETEQAIYDTATAMVVPSKIKQFCGERLREMRPMNRSERRIVIAQARRAERKNLRAERRKRGLQTLGESGE